MGWNLVAIAKQAPLVADLPPEACFYFVHSFHVRCERPEDVLLTTDYGGTFHSGFQVGNVWGVQFHPEKSHRFGMILLRSFAERC
jgi:glutamine amidotransferase